MPKIIQCALAVCVSWPALHAQQPAASAHRPRVAVVRSTIDSLAKAFVAAGEAPGVSVVVIRGRDTLVSAGDGLSSITF